MRLRLPASVFLIALMCGGAAAQPAEPFYKGKTLTILVGLESGGTVDLFVRNFSQFLRRHFRGSPAIAVQNMPGGGGLTATNYLAHRAKPDGLTILYGPWDPLAQALSAPGLQARYENFSFIGATGDVRVLYGRNDMVSGGLKSPADIARAQNVLVGALSPTDISGLLPHLALNVLGISNRRIVGYRGGADVFVAMQRGEVQLNSTSITTFRGRTAGFIASGEGRGIAYLVPADKDGRFDPVPYIADMPAFPDLYRDISGQAPEGPMWEALNWLTRQIGEMTFVGFAPQGTPPEAVAELRAAFAAASNDPDFVRQSLEQNGAPYSFVGPPRAAAIFESLAGVTPAVLSTLKEVTSAGR